MFFWHFSWRIFPSGQSFRPVLQWKISLLCHLSQSIINVNRKLSATRSARQLSGSEARTTPSEAYFQLAPIVAFSLLCGLWVLRANSVILAGHHLFAFTFLVCTCLFTAAYFFHRLNESLSRLLIRSNDVQDHSGPAHERSFPVQPDAAHATRLWCCDGQRPTLPRVSLPIDQNLANSMLS